MSILHLMNLLNKVVFATFASIITDTNFPDFLNQLTASILEFENENKSSEPGIRKRKYFLPDNLPWTNQNLEVLSQLFNVLALSEPQCDLVLLAVSFLVLLFITPSSSSLL